MQKIAGVALLVVGILLAVWGVNASEAADSSISKLFTGAPTNKAIYLIVGGVLTAIAGASLAWYPRGTKG